MLQVEVCRRLLAAGADARLVNGEGCTALAVAEQGAAAHDAKEALAFGYTPPAKATASAGAGGSAARERSAGPAGPGAEEASRNPLAAAEAAAAEEDAAPVAATLAASAMARAAFAVEAPVGHGGLGGGGAWGRVGCLLRGERVPPPDPRALVKGCRVRWKVSAYPAPRQRQGRGSHSFVDFF